MNDIKSARKKAFEDLREILDINEQGFAVRYYQCNTDDYVWKYADGAWEYKGNMTHDRILGRECCPIDLVRKNCQYVFAEPQTAAPQYFVGEWEIKPSLAPTCQRVGSPTPGENDVVQDSQQAGDSNKGNPLWTLTSYEIWKRLDESVTNASKEKLLAHFGESLKIGEKIKFRKSENFDDGAQEECDRISKITKGLCK